MKVYISLPITGKDLERQKKYAHDDGRGEAEEKRIVLHAAAVGVLTVVKGYRHNGEEEQ